MYVCICLETNKKKLYAGSVEATKMGGQKERILAKSTKDSTSSVIGFTKTAKKQERNNVSMSSSEVDKVSAPQCSPRNPRESNGRSRVKGKVREFVRMFNQEASPKPKDGLNFRSQSCKWDKKCVFEDEPSNNTTKTDEKLQVPNVTIMSMVLNCVTLRVFLVHITVLLMGKV